MSRTGFIRFGQLSSPIILVFLVIEFIKGISLLKMLRFQSIRIVLFMNGFTKSPNMVMINLKSNLKSRNDLKYKRDLG